MKHDTHSLFDEAVDAVERRARHMLGREAVLGRSSPVRGKARLREGELHDRLLRLHSRLPAQIETAEGRAAEVPEVSGGAWQFLLAEASDALPRSHLWRLNEDEIAHRLRHLWTALDDLLGEIERSASLIAKEFAGLDVNLRALTPDEIEFYFSESDFSAYDIERASRLALLVDLEQQLRQVSSEVVALIAGRFQSPPGPCGRYPNQRGRRFAAELIGIAEGFGLKPTRNHAPGPNHRPTSATDAYLSALDRIAAPDDPVARQVFDEAPRTFSAVVRRLLEESDPGRESSDREMAQARKIGRVLGARAREADGTSS